MTTTTDNRVGADDAAEILAVLALYAQLIDNRDWAELHRVFAPDFVFGAGLSGGGSDGVRGYDALATLIAGVTPYHPHYTTDTVLHRLPDGRVTAWSKFLIARTDGTAGSGDYLDLLVRTAHGWRIQSREASRGNRPPTDPGGPSARYLSSQRWRSTPA